ncbi:MAG TPA: twin-arginine translocase TatA/TatE family subunit [Candidatus Tenderia electrophaga]|uniref:Sec-independent protein translocase protein TatA n=1 Tax=Candidatus Tenderia electrophaga TaxID=1748243 RepID=A0A832J457_9GAMM|nr:twin-arginine translocase TatA/TatE family subunit [Candidatus Tenderia electrophaga]
MGFGGISVWQLLIVLVIVLLLFGSKKLRGLGSDLGGALKGFRGAMQEGEKGEEKPADQTKLDNVAGTEERVIDSEANKQEEKKV